MSSEDRKPDWKSVSETSPHLEHWHFGDSESDDWASIKASDTDSIAGFNDNKWTIEFYNGVDDIVRKHADSYREMLEVVVWFMDQHENEVR